MKWRKYALIRIKYVNVWKCERTNSPYRQMDIIHNVWWFAYLSVCCCTWSMRECRDHDLNWMRKFFRTKNKHVQQSIWLTPFQTKYKNHDDKNTDALSKHLFYCAIRFFSCLNGLYTIYIYMYTSHFWTISIDCVTKNFISVSKCSCRSHLWLVHICFIHSIATWQTVDV